MRSEFTPRESRISASAVMPPHTQSWRRTQRHTTRTTRNSGPHSRVSHGPHSRVSHDPHSRVSHGPHSRVSHGPHSRVSHDPHSRVSHNPHSRVSHDPHSRVSNGPHSRVSHGSHSRVSHGPHSRVSHGPHTQSWRRTQSHTTRTTRNSGLHSRVSQGPHSRVSHGHPIPSPHTVLERVRSKATDLWRWYYISLDSSESIDIKKYNILLFKICLHELEIKIFSRDSIFVAMSVHAHFTAGFWTYPFKDGVRN